MEDRSVNWKKEVSVNWKKEISNGKRLSVFLESVSLFLMFIFH